jgi:ornithine cyclodeaminase/alanine dehydrogenase-like protein (mu-crystallin family)
MDSREITSLRTAAATAVAVKYLARPNSRTLTICGCGTQGRVQALAVAHLCPLTEIFTFDKDAIRASDLAQALANELNLPATAVLELASAVRCSDICVTCTTSNQPLLGPDDVGPGTFIAAVGADNPEKSEIHPRLLANNKIVVDVLNQCAMIGDLHHALDAGVVSRSNVHAELGEIVAGKKPGRESAEEIIVFDSTGMALQDVAAAAMVYERACQLGKGARLALAA